MSGRQIFIKTKLALHFWKLLLNTDSKFQYFASPLLPHWTWLNEEIRFIVWNILRFLRKLNLGCGVISRKVASEFASDPSRSEHIRHRAEDFQFPRIIVFWAHTVEDNNICQEQMTEVKENTLCHPRVRHLLHLLLGSENILC